MEAPQIIMIMVFTLAFVVNALLHGKPQKPYNLWSTIVAIIFNTVLLWWGGFWS